MKPSSLTSRERAQVEKVVANARHRTHKVKNAKRNLAITRLYAGGRTLEEVGSRYGISRERVRQILRLLGVSVGDSLRHQRAQNKLRDVQRKHLDYMKRIERKYGMSYANFLRINKIVNGQRRRIVDIYHYSRCSARRNKTRWNLTFPQWHDIWKHSGKIDYIGRQEGEYILWRIDKTKGFILGNVRVMKLHTKEKAYKHRLSPARRSR